MSFSNEFFNLLQAHPNTQVIVKSDKKSSSKTILKFSREWKELKGKCFLIEFKRGTDLCVVDVDNVSFLSKMKGMLPKTLTIGTPSGGVHFWFRLPEYVSLPPIFSVFAEKPVLLQTQHHYNVVQQTTERTIDLLTFPGQVAIPPSPNYGILMKKPVANAPDVLLDFWWEKAKEIRRRMNLTLI